MITAITSTSDNENALFDKRFGRAEWFCILDEESGQMNFYKNEYANAQGGAGTKASELMMQMKVNKVISGDFGPKAKDLLEKFGIQMVIPDDQNRSVKDFIYSILQKDTAK